MENNKELLIDNITKIRPGVRKFYKGKKVFLTGCTGFLGMVIIEKLLYSLDVDTIYILLREKRGKSMQTRLKEMTHNVYFEALKKKDIEFQRKLIPLNGDCSFAGLGLSDTDVTTLVTNTNIVYHCAATVRFDEPLDVAYGVNVAGTQAVVNLCCRMRHLQAFVYVSTAYSHCNKQTIKECFYECTYNPFQIDTILSQLSPDEIKAKTSQIIGSWPNTYTFTKALAEDVIRRECQTLPVAIFRPAIVVSTYKGCIPGWVNNYYGPMGISAHIALGLTRTFFTAIDESCDLVPVDKVADGIIAAAWEIGTRNTNTKRENLQADIKIYNYVSSSTANSITWSEFSNMLLFYILKYPLQNCKYLPYFTPTVSPIIYNLKKYLYHYIPAYFGDVFLFVTGNKPTNVIHYRKYHRNVDMLNFFTGNKWTYSIDNTEQLYQMLSQKDQQLLPFSILDINWIKFMQTYVLGIRRYMFKEDDVTIGPACKRIQNIALLKAALRFLLYAIIAKYVYGLYVNSQKTC